MLFTPTYNLCSKKIGDKKIEGSPFLMHILDHIKLMIRNTIWKGLLKSNPFCSIKFRAKKKNYDSIFTYLEAVYISTEVPDGEIEKFLRITSAP